MVKHFNAVKLHENVPPDWYFRSIKENILQRYWHKRRFEEVSKLIEKSDGKILDIGCADGVFTKVIFEKAKPSKIIGVDILPKSVTWAKKHWKNPKMEFIVSDAENLKYESNTFDAVFILEVLEHVNNPQKILFDVKRILTKNGYAILLVPTDSLLFRIIWFFWTKFRGKIWKETHIQTYRNNYLTRICKKVGFRIEEDKKFLLGMLQTVKVRKI
ncbi:methyltransferase domain-containing protein [Patescibacteria group bacterium]|nr:methyltransferase domain-containing protein [Patescibacteria group bacterium]MBU2036511.1 methyltransferase domain-containing protein [Patescibacteria group bacterium]